ncbi:MAG: AAA family ATPase [Mariniphaga sp.]
MENSHENSPESFANRQAKDSNNNSINPNFDFSIFNSESNPDEENKRFDQDNEISEELAKRIIDLSKDEPDIEFLFDKDGVGCIPIGDISVIKGKAKTGKSTVLVIWISALLKGDCIGFSANKQGLRALYIDTEQNPANTRRLARKVHRLCGYSNNMNQQNFIAINLRGDNPKDRIKYLDEAVNKFKIDLLILDGAKDLISNGDINDNKSCGETVQKMMTLCKFNNVAIITILHENKNDNNLRGVIGTELLNKCAESWQVIKDGEIFKVEQLDCRNVPAGGFRFTLDDNALPIPMEREAKVSVKERTETKKLDTFQQCLPQMTCLSYTELTKLYSEYYPCGIETAKKDVAAFLKKGYLIHQSGATYKFNYQKS